MPNPVKRHSKTRRNMRRAHDFLTGPSISVCPQCKEPKLPHRVCARCGFYKGREIIPIEKTS
ncbi:MAG: 50S ribosomal protein L32 [Deltaproteobacteria bacterium]|nr:50S ribosomal protein L32 [Deltaproteobacteria bacterium]